MEGNITNDICQGFPSLDSTESGANATTIIINIGRLLQKNAGIGQAPNKRQNRSSGSRNLAFNCGTLFIMREVGCR